MRHPWMVLCAALLIGGALGAAEGAPPSSAVEKAAAAVAPALVRLRVVDIEYESGRAMKGEATGSGVIFTQEGHIITNHHVAGKAKQIVCTMADRSEIDAELVGTDPLTDISVIRLRPKEPRAFAVARFGDSSRLQVGDPVLAMGSPLALSQSVTMGIVSNTELVMPDLFWPFKFQVEGEDVGSIVRWIGHDAKINPGNSGGPLVNLDGEVVGINEMQFGLSGAIPGNLARKVAEELVAHGQVVRAWLGLEVQPLLRSEPRQEGALVSGVIPGSPAAKAGFASGDVLVSLAGETVSVRVPEELPIFNQVVADLPLGKPAAAVVERDGKQVTLQVTPEEREPWRPREREFEEWGLTGRDLSGLEAKERRRESPDGVLITSLRSGGPSDDAKPKLLEDDILLAVDGRPLKTTDDLAAVTQELTKEQSEPRPVVVTFERKALQCMTVVKVGKEKPSEPGHEVRKAWLPVEVQVLTGELAEALHLDKTGVRITQVYPHSSAEKAGLAVGDFIVAIDGTPIPASRPEHFDVFPAMLRQYPVGTEVTLSVIRGTEERTLKVKLERSPTPAQELAKYEDDRFEFTVRDVSETDRAEERWPQAQQGAYVVSVSEGSWAALGHLAVGDLILHVQGEATASADDLKKAMEKVASAKPDTVVLHVQRGIHDLYLELRPKWQEAG